jgi:hypothetical protein
VGAAAGARGRALSTARRSLQSLMALARFGEARGTFADAGLGAEFFPGGTDAAGAVGYMITAGQRLSVPIKVRGDLVLDKDAKRSL